MGAYTNQAFTPTARGTNLLFVTTSDDTTGNAERMRIAASGNVGIGTTSPLGLLDVRGAIIAGSGLNNTSTRPAVGTARIAGEIAGVSSQGLVYDDGFLRLSAGGGTNSVSKTFIDLSGFSTVPDMNKNIVFGTYNTERMRIDSAGNVGIGTTSPVALLHVAGSTGAPSLSANAGIAMIADKNGADPLGLNIGRDIASPYSVWLQTKRISNDGSSWPMTLNPLGGNVGIGTTSPASLLQVGGAAIAGGALPGINVAVAGGAYVLASDGTRSAFMGVDASNYGMVGSLSNHDFTLRTNNVERVRISSGGNVGIGTTAPGNLLDVGSASQFRVNSTGNLTKVNNVAYSWPASQGGASTTLTNDGSGNLTWSSGGSSQWTTSASNIYYNTGNVGVGTSNPTAKLQVEGDIAATGTGKVLFGYSIQTYASAGTAAARAACPANSMILGGGCWATGGGMAGRNYPSTENTDGTAVGTAVADGASAAYSWTCSASASGVTAYAICGRVGP
jgi:hypothetical protein